MVAPIILLGGLVAGIIFFARGGLEQFQAFAESVTTKEEKKQGSALVPTLQTGEGSVPIASGSLRTVNSIESEQIIRTDVANKRKFNPASEKPPIQVFFDNPKEGGVLASQKGQIVGSNLSIQSGQQFGTGEFGLTQDQISSIRNEDFTEQELEDIEALTRRFNRKSPASQRVSRSPEELVIAKRIEARRAERFVNIVTSFGGTTRGGFVIPDKRGVNLNPDFVLGGKSLKEFNADQQERTRINLKIQENAMLNKQRRETGEQVLSTIKKSGLNQQQFFRERGINLNAGNLSALALGKLLGGLAKSTEKGGRDPISLEKTIDATVEKAEPVQALTSLEVFQLSDAEKIARFRAGERFT